MMNYLGEALVLVVGILFGGAMLGYVCKTVFAEMAKYRKKQTEPYEKALNKLLDTSAEGIGKMITMAADAMEESRKYDSKIKELREEREKEEENKNSKYWDDLKG